MDDIHSILKQQGRQIYDLLVAIKGDNLTNYGGIVGKVNDIAQQMDRMEKQIEKTDRLTKTLKVYVMILWLAAGSVLTAFFAIAIRK